MSDPLVRRVIGCALSVHRELGPGLLESSYNRCFQAELSYRAIPFRREVGVSHRLPRSSARQRLQD